MDPTQAFDTYVHVWRDISTSIDVKHFAEKTAKNVNISKPTFQEILSDKLKRRTADDFRFGNARLVKGIRRCC